MRREITVYAKLTIGDFLSVALHTPFTLHGNIEDICELDKFQQNKDNSSFFIKQPFAPLIWSLEAFYMRKVQPALNSRDMFKSKKPHER